ncbi:hypothetical protein ACLOAV_000661 [Pseudogymnoascus australis]
MSSYPPTMPSMLTNPGACAIRPATIQPNSTRSRVPKSTSGPAPRKTLNDDDRRLMCQIHEDNPGVKQAEIGCELLTVSKVLRHKEKFLSLEEPSASPPKQSKGDRVPDIERTLKSWWVKDRDSGILRTRDEIREKAIKFATILRSQEGIQRANDDQWLDSFERSFNAETKKDKRTARKKSSRRSSEANTSKVATYGQSSAGSSVANTPGGHSPGSPYDEDDYTSFGSSGYRLSNSRSTTSLSSTFTDTTVGSSFSGGPSSPSTPFSFSPETTQGPFAPPQYVRAIAPAYPQRPRSQTFPMVAVDPDTATTATFPHHSTSPPALDASSEPMVTTPATTASTASTSPTTDDARIALETFLNYMEIAAPQGLVDEFEYQTVVKLTERMRQHSLGSIRGISESDTDAGNMECRMGVVLLSLLLLRLFSLLGMGWESEIGVGSRKGWRGFNPPRAFYSAEMDDGDTSFNWGLEKGVDCMEVKSDRLERPRAYMARKGREGRKVVAEEGRLNRAGTNQ